MRWDILTSCSTINRRKLNNPETEDLFHNALPNTLLFESWGVRSADDSLLSYCQKKALGKARKFLVKDWVAMDMAEKLPNLDSTFLTMRE